MKNKDKSKKCLLLKILIPIAVVLCIAVGIILFLIMNKEEDRDFNSFAHIISGGETVSETEADNNSLILPPTYSHGSLFSFERNTDENEEPEFTNPLTGLASDRDLSDVRPVAIMINNIQASCPQEGISGADIIYECLAEGGITRLLAVVTDYESLGVIGSIRSSREYYIDFAANHDAIYVHAGGSEEAYSQILSRSIDHLDGVNSDARTGINLTGISFYRDSTRAVTMSYEHTLVSTGVLISEGITTMGYRTEISASNEDPICPVNRGWNVILNGDNAEYISIPYRTTQTVEYEYDAETEKYLRYQFTHSAHIDNTTGEQLAFDNIIILNLAHRNRGDSYNHLDVYTTGNGEGYYITKGQIIPIKWSKQTTDSQMTLTDAEGYTLIVNKGKTVINIVDDTVYSQMSVN